MVNLVIVIVHVMHIRNVSVVSVVVIKMNDDFGQVNLFEMVIVFFWYTSYLGDTCAICAREYSFSSKYFMMNIIRMISEYFSDI